MYSLSLGSDSAWPIGASITRSGISVFSWVLVSVNRSRTIIIGDPMECQPALSKAFPPVRSLLCQFAEQRRQGYIQAVSWDSLSLGFPLCQSHSSQRSVPRYQQQQLICSQPSSWNFPRQDYWVAECLAFFRRLTSVNLCAVYGACNAVTY